MTQFLLLHGSWHGAWCWHKIVPRLVAAGHQATAIDLPGRGRAPATPAWVSLDRMVRAAEAALPPTGKTTIVVHSRNGIVASTLAERCPERVERTLYLASFMLPTGRRVLDYLPDSDSAIGRHIHVDRLALRDRLARRSTAKGSTPIAARTTSRWRARCWCPSRCGRRSRG